MILPEGQGYGRTAPPQMATHAEQTSTSAPNSSRPHQYKGFIFMAID
jgi:hypothetical protein